MSKDRLPETILGDFEEMCRKIYQRLEENFKILHQDNKLRNISESKCDEIICYMDFLRKAAAYNKESKTNIEKIQSLMDDFDFKSLFLDNDDSEEGVCSSCPIPSDAFDSEVLNRCSITIGTDHMIKLPKGVKGNESAPKRPALIWVGINAPDKKQISVIKRTYDLVRIHNGDGDKISVDFINELVKTYSDGNFLGLNDGYVTDDKLIMGVLAPHAMVYRLDELNRLYLVSNTRNGKFLSYETLNEQWNRVTGNAEKEYNWVDAHMYEGIMDRFEDHILCNDYVGTVSVLSDERTSDYMLSRVLKHDPYREMLYKFFEDYEYQGEHLVAVDCHVTVHDKHYSKVVKTGVGYCFPMPEFWPATIFEGSTVGDIIRVNTPYGRLVLVYM